MLAVCYYRSSRQSPFFATFLVTRPLGACCVLLTAPCSLLLTRYSPPNYSFCLLASSRPLIVARCSSLLAICYLFLTQQISSHTNARRTLQSAYYLHHCTLIASHTWFLSSCTQIPVLDLLYSARRSLPAAQYFFLASLCVPLRSCFSYLAAR